MDQPVVRTHEYARRRVSLEHILMDGTIRDGSLDVLCLCNWLTYYAQSGEWKHRKTWLGAWHVSLPVHTQLFVVRPKQLGGVDGFRRAQEQVALGAKSIVEEVYDVSLNGAVEVD